jgi:hypothetical protein
LHSVDEALKAVVVRYPEAFFKFLGLPWIFWFFMPNGYTEPGARQFRHDFVIRLADGINPVTGAKTVTVALLELDNSGKPADFDRHLKYYRRVKDVIMKDLLKEAAPEDISFRMAVIYSTPSRPGT